jgi:hypothetical protein
MVDPQRGLNERDVSLAVIKLDLEYIKSALVENQADNRRLNSDLMALIKVQHEDHEQRLRALERQTPWRTLSEAVTGVIAVIAVALGLRQQ